MDEHADRNTDVNADVLQELQAQFGESIAAWSAADGGAARDGILTVWVPKGRAHDVLDYLRNHAENPFDMLYDLFVIDERTRTHLDGLQNSDFTVVYNLFAFERVQWLRIKVALRGEYPSIRTITDIWTAANWYEREAWDLFGVTFEGHPHLSRIYLPPGWQGHPGRKEYPARATEVPPYQLSLEEHIKQEEALQFKPEDWGMRQAGDDTDYLFLNYGPSHPGTHGLLRLILQLDGEVITDAVPDIGFHHRGAEKMAERQTWHTYIPYTDRVDYLGGVLNNLPYVLAVEKLAGIEVPDRVKVIRVMMSELFRLSNHLVFLGTFAQDVGFFSMVFWTFADRERVFDIVEAITGARMHPSWFRIGGLAQDLPTGWDTMIREFIEYMPRRLVEYDRVIINNVMFKARTKHIGAYTTDAAIEWGVTGPGLRATGLAWDFRKVQPYSGYDQFEFEIPTGANGDSFDRGYVHVEEMRQSIRIIRQCLENMPEGDYKARHPLTTPPLKEHTMHDIETLIDHFLGVSWGPVIPAGEAFVNVEGVKGANGYYLVSDEDIHSYRTRIRTPSFPHLQMVPAISRGLMVPDMAAILGSLDFVLSDSDK